MIYWDEILCFPLACDLQISLKCKAFVTGRCWVCTEWPRWCVMSHISYEINWPCVESIVSCSFVLLTQINLQWSCVWLSVITVQQNEAATSILTQMPNMVICVVWNIMAILYTGSCRKIQCYLCHNKWRGNDIFVRSHQ